MNIVIFGSGKYYEARKWYFNDVNVSAFLDNNEKKIGCEIDGIRCFRVGDISQLKFDFIVIMSNIYKQEMHNQLLMAGVGEDKILYFEQCGKLYYSSDDVSLYNREQSIYLPENSKKRITVFSHDMSFTGAPVVLFYACKILVTAGYEVIVVGANDGPIRKALLENQVKVLIDVVIDLSQNKYLESILHSSWRVLFNTIMMDSLVRQFYRLNKKGIWWLHDASLYYQKIENPCYQYKTRENIKTYAVSKLAAQTYQKYTGFSVNGYLPYGLPDMNKNEKSKKREEKIIFAIIGTIDRRKGHDLFMQAISYLTLDQLKAMEIWIIGNQVDDDLDLYEELKSLSLSHNEIKLFGGMEREELMKFYEKIDVVVCPSREDPLPVVLTEAMMFEKVCITSDMTGTSAFMKDKVDGLIFKSENVYELCEKIQWVLENVNQIENIGKNARKLYLQYFSIETFRNNILTLIEE